MPPCRYRTVESLAKKMPVSEIEGMSLDRGINATRRKGINVGRENGFTPESRAEAVERAPDSRRRNVIASLNGFGKLWWEKNKKP